MKNLQQKVTYWLHQRGSGEIFYYRLKSPALSRVVEKSTATTDRKLAEKLAQRACTLAELDLENGRDPLRLSNLSATMMCDWDQDRANSGAATNRAHIEKRIPEYWRILDTFFTDYYSIGPDQISAYIAHRKQRVTPQTIRRELQALRRGLIAAEDHGYTVRVPQIGRKLRAAPRSPKTSSKTFTLEQYVAWFRELRNIDRRGSTGSYATAIWCLATNWRHGEFARLDRCIVRPPKESLDQPYMMVEYDDTVRKVKRAGCQAIPPEVAQLLPLVSRRPGDHREAWMFAAARAGLDRAPTRRDLRAAYATAAGEGLADPYGIDLAMNHARGTSLRYQHGDDRRMAQVAAAVWRIYSVLLGEVTKR